MSLTLMSSKVPSPMQSVPNTVAVFTIVSFFLSNLLGLTEMAPCKVTLLTVSLWEDRVDCITHPNYASWAVINRVLMEVQAGTRSEQGWSSPTDCSKFLHSIRDQVKMQNIRIQVLYTRVHKGPKYSFPGPPNSYPMLGWRPGMFVLPQLLGLINESKERGSIQ